MRDVDVHTFLYATHDQDTFKEHVESLGFDLAPDWYTPQYRLPAARISAKNDCVERILGIGDRDNWPCYVVAGPHLSGDPGTRGRLDTLKYWFEFISHTVTGPYDVIDASPAWTNVKLLVRITNDRDAVTLKLSVPSLYTMREF